MTNTLTINLAELTPEVILRLLIEAKKNNDIFLITTIINFIKSQHSIEAYLKAVENL